MIFDRNVSDYRIFEEASLREALEKLDATKGRVLFAVDAHDRLLGVVTVGDVLRWLRQSPLPDLDTNVARVANRSCRYGGIHDTRGRIEALFSPRISEIPIIDDQRRLVAVAHRDRRALHIGDFRIGDTDPCFIIAEIGNNHNGSLDLAKRLVDLAAEAGANCAKFQMRHLDSLYAKRGVEANLGTEYTLDLLERFQLSSDEMYQAFDHCKSVGLVPLCTPWDLASLAALESYGMPAYKIASADLTNHQLLEAAARTLKPLLCSTGMSREDEVLEAVELLRGFGAPCIMLHCNSTYPTPLKDVNLRYLDRLREIAGGPVGYSGHERGINVAIAAAARGAKIIEKHFTIDRDMEGSDHRISLLPAEFAQMVQAIREVEESLGTGGIRGLSQGEQLNRVNLAKSLVVTRAIAPGEIITADALSIRSPGRGLQPNKLKEIVGRPATRSLQPGDVLYQSDLDGLPVHGRSYSFRRAWGVPIRYHDMQALIGASNPRFVEFHFSYRDLEEDPAKRVRAAKGLGVIVHAPELFAHDHILDLTSADEAYRRRSIAEMRRVLDVAAKLKEIFAHPSRVQVVTNVGGASDLALADASARSRLYARLRESLLELQHPDCEILPQTMPPFPWHFGGQRHHNLFVYPAEIAAFAKETGSRICFDVSHSRLACNFYKWSWEDYIRTIGRYVAHLHIADASDVDQEGLQIGEGDIDFTELGQLLDRYAPKEATFIPEVWQGHENNGEGFWKALNLLEGKL
jgi:N-acetylneuraminate synthase